MGLSPRHVTKPCAVRSRRRASTHNVVHGSVYRDRERKRGTKRVRESERSKRAGRKRSGGSAREPPRRCYLAYGDRGNERCPVLTGSSQQLCRILSVRSSRAIISTESQFVGCGRTVRLAELNHVSRSLQLIVNI